MKSIKCRAQNLLLFIVAASLLAPVSLYAQGRGKAKGRGKSAAFKAVPLKTVFSATSSPIISFRIQFMTGSAYDPAGKEGLASLTAAMIAQGGSKALSYDEITSKFYPIAVGFGWQADKEMTTFIGSTHVDNLDKYYSIIKGMLLDPGFREDDFKRLKSDAITFLKNTLRNNNDEELGKERLYNIIYAGNPYEHHSMGRVSSLEKITLQDVKDFYARNYNKTNLVIGLSGGFDTKFSKELYADMQRLPAGDTNPNAVKNAYAPISLSSGTKIDIVKRETRATAISMGFPIKVRRGDPDYPALALVASYFGQHRSSNSYLYQKIREKRGLNYGDYAYIEYFPRGMFQFEPDANLGRTSQIFQMWIRPVEPHNAHFTLRAALFEYDKLVKEGMSQEKFEATRQFLSKYVNILTQTQDSELGYALDSRYYGIGNFNNYMKAALAKLTLAQVNAAIKKHLSTNAMRIVMVTKDAEGLRDAILSGKPSDIKYNAPPPQAILDEDKIVREYKIPVTDGSIKITPVDKVFE
jgi:zinc protease